MPFVAPDPLSYLGQVVPHGQCVAYVRAATNAPHTSGWVEGKPVWEVAASLARGTAIATFDASGRYANRTDGSSHAAIFLAAGEDGMEVVDQWTTGTEHHPVARRVIRAKGGTGPACDDADAYHVVEAEDD